MKIINNIIKYFNNKIYQFCILNVSVLLIAIIGAMIFSSCTSDISENNSRGSRGVKDVGSVPITIHLLYAPKEVKYTPGELSGSDNTGGYKYQDSTAEITDPYCASVWAWQVISAGNENYCDRAWPGNLVMTPYDKNGERLLKSPYDDKNSTDFAGDGQTKVYSYPTLSSIKDDVYEWQFQMNANSKYPLGILFVDPHAITHKEGDQFAWEQTNDVQIAKEDLTRNANFYFVYGKQTYYKTYEESQGLQAASIADNTMTTIEVTMYSGTTDYTKNNFIVTDCNAILNSDGTVKDITTTDEAGASITTPSGNILTIDSISDVSSTGLKIKLAASSNDFPYQIYYKEVTGSNTIIKGPVWAHLTSEMIDAVEMNSDDENFGITFNNDGTVLFKTWAPTAKSVGVLLFQNMADAGQKADNMNKWSRLPKEPGDGTNTCELIQMEKVLDANGAWRGAWAITLQQVNIQGFAYYKYRLKFFDKGISDKEAQTLENMKGSDDSTKYSWVNTIECMRLAEKCRTYDVPDMWAYVGGKDGIATQLIDINDSSAKCNGWTDEYYNPWTNGWSGSGGRPYSDAILYEANVADWGTGCKGTFQNLENNDFISHIKDLGVTHVILMPIQDYVYTDADLRYNWGICTYNFNTVESRYVVSMASGADGVKQFRELVQAFHNNGIAVLMNVAYTHTGNNKVSIGSQSIFDSMVPEYFYRVNNGIYSNGTNQGSEIASTRVMAKKYIIDSLKHWMRDYHINGFSFYLMSLFDKVVMEDIYTELYAIDNSVIIVGEPWDSGRNSSVNDSTNCAAQLCGAGGNGYGIFDNEFRDAVKGKELRGFTRGQVQGMYNDKNIEKVMLGKTNYNTTGLKGLTVHYIEYHDDNTLFDKLLLSGDSQAGKGSYTENTVPLFTSRYDEILKYIDDIKAQDKLAAAYLILAQGTPFISEGQEFMRTKNGNADSSEAGIRRDYPWGEKQVVECNLIDYSLRQKYDDVYSVYKGLIALRRDYLTDFSGNDDATVETLPGASGVTKYKTGKFVIYFNATDSDYQFSASDTVKGRYVKIDGTMKLNSDGTWERQSLSNSLKFSGISSMMVQDLSGVITSYEIESTETILNSVPKKSFVIMKTE